MAIGEKRILPWSVNGVEADGTGNIALGTGQVTGLDAALQKKADKTAVDAALLEKADAMAVETALSTKANQAEVAAALVGKANWNGGVLSGGANVLDWALTQEINTCCSCDNTVTGVPISGYWMMQLRIYPGAGWRILEAHNVLTGCSYSNTYNVRAWDGWIGPLVTATPPQEYALPLAAGYTSSAGFVSVYSRDQLSRLHVEFNSVQYSGVIPVGEVQIATLPHGYRPAHPVDKSLTLDSASLDSYTVRCWVYPNGVISIFVRKSGYSELYGQIEFNAA